MRGSGDYDRKKKGYSRLSDGLCVVLFFVVAGNFDYDRKKKDTVVCLAGARSLLRPEKKDTIVNIQFVLIQLKLKLIQIRQFNFHEN